MATRVEEAYSERDQTINAKDEVTEIEIPLSVGQNAFPAKGWFSHLKLEMVEMPKEIRNAQK